MRSRIVSSRCKLGPLARRDEAVDLVPAFQEQLAQDSSRPVP